MVNFKYNDIRYNEAEGIYIVYSGYVDLVDTGKKKCLHSLGMIESFGDSKVLERVSYEYLGDLYAGLYPSKARENAKMRLFKKGMKEMLNPYAKENKIKDLLKNTFKTKMRVHTVVPTADVHDVVFSDEECTLCVFIPYDKFFESVPSNEVQHIKESFLNKNAIEQVINLVSNHAGVPISQLFKY